MHAPRLGQVRVTSSPGELPQLIQTHPEPPHPPDLHRGAALPPRASIRTTPERHDEGPAQRQEDLWQVQGDPPPRACHGHLRERPPQAAAGL